MTQKYIGIADAHGIESFLPYDDNKEAFPIALRANANRQRHAVVYIAELGTEEVKSIKALVEASKFKEALILMKQVARTIGFPERHVKEYSQSWELIPNDLLDPYWSPDDETTDRASEVFTGKGSILQNRLDKKCESNLYLDGVWNTLNVGGGTRVRSKRSDHMGGSRPFAYARYTQDLTSH